MCLAPSPTVLSTDEVGSVAPPIFTSVGQDAVKGPVDVFIIQSLLNKRLPKPHTDVPVTGTADPGTILAIKAFQAVMMGMNPPTGQVAPGSPTYYALAARPLVSQEPARATPFGHVGIVPPDVIEPAKASQRRWGVPASITVALRVSTESGASLAARSATSTGSSRRSSSSAGTKAGPSP